MSTSDRIVKLAAQIIEASTYKEYVERKKREGEKPLTEEQWKARTQGTRSMTRRERMMKDKSNLIDKGKKRYQDEFDKAFEDAKAKPGETSKLLKEEQESGRYYRNQ